MAKPVNGTRYPQINTNTAVSLGTIVVFLACAGGIVTYIGNIRNDVTKLETRTSERIGTLETSVTKLQQATDQIGIKQNEQTLKQSEQNNKLDVRLTRIEMMLQQALRTNGVRVRVQ